MDRSKIRIMFVSKGTSDLSKWIEIAERVREGLQGDCEFLIVSSIKNTRQLPGYISYQNAYDRFEDFGRRYRLKTIKEVSEALCRHADYILPTAYMSDERSILKAEDDFSLAIEQLYLIERTTEIYKEFQPTHVFISGAGTMIRTVFFALADIYSAHRYRVLAAHHMTPGRKDMRYFFCDNDLGDISRAEGSLFDHEENDLDTYTGQFLDSVTNRKYRMDSYARTIGRYWRISKPGIGMVRDFASMMNGMIKKDRFKYQKAKSKLVFTSRSFMQKRIFDPVTSIEDPFVLLPLNVPGDAQLMLRAKEWQDTESLIRLFASNLPYGVQLVVKAHPGNPGALPGNLISRLRRNFPHIRIISHDVDLGMLLKKCAAAIVVNGTAALETSLIGKPCIYLGSSYLSRLPNAFPVKSVSDIERTIIRCLQCELTEGVKGAHELLKRFYLQTFPSLNDRQKNDPSKINPMIADGITALIRKQNNSLDMSKVAAQ